MTEFLMFLAPTISFMVFLMVIDPPKRKAKTNQQIARERLVEDLKK